MEKSTWMVFSVIKNIYTFVKKNKEVNLFEKVNYFNFKRASRFFIENSKRIYNEIENGYYTYHELALYILYQYMITNSFKLYDVKQKTVKEVMKLFTTKNYQEDLKIIEQIHKKLKFKRGLKDYFEIREDGTNIAYMLTKKKQISPIFFIRNCEISLTEPNENVIILSREYKQFNRIAKKIKETLKGGLSDDKTKI